MSGVTAEEAVQRLDTLTEKIAELKHLLSAALHYMDTDDDGPLRDAHDVLDLRDAFDR